ncbi:right-handed parallel beta-helix repeat-containing protein [Methanobrevibacter thaueri]|uniref:Polymorphic membrane protein n=1 Tax=Methanobrevibacter thaueri TaxID=190975 RepID=A0A315YCI8_9EURY|nr:right-handed parallel beta-helix repeat-containing protein [Methanobrevibacter thaueri]PWB88322.1 polymorphic membrane protein [Methanobrevibacter thaueri]
MGIIKKTLILTVFLILMLSSLNVIYAENAASANSDLQNSTAKTYTDLSAKINENPYSDSIDLTESYRFDDDKDFNLSDGVVISKNITITGYNNASIDGNNKARGLFIDYNCTVTLKNLIFKNGFSESDGGAIILNANSTLTLLNCTFLNNNVYNSNGGAIAVYKNTTLNVYKSTFTNNTAIRASDLEWKQFKQGMGSSIASSTGAYVNLQDTRFIDNHGYLTTILVVSYDDIDYRVSTLIVNNCLFENNTSNSSGVIYLDELGQGEIRNSIFRNNYVSTSGGTIVLDACHSAVVDRCSFESNHAVKGGAIQIKVFEYDYRSNVTIINCNFTNNRASEHGGAVYSKYGLTKIYNCIFENNYCDKGGAIYAKFATLTISDSEFNRNSALYGGALFLRTDNNYIDDTIFKNNRASVKGGAVYTKMEGISSNNCQYIGNHAHKGNDVYGVFYAQITQTSSIFSDVQLKIRITSPWKLSIPQKIKLTFKGSKNYKTGWIYTASNGYLYYNLPLDLDVGKYSLTISMESGICNANPTINVVKAPAKLAIKKCTTRYKSDKSFKFYVKNAKTGKAIRNAKLNLKVYTGKHYNVYNVKSDSNGLVKFDTSKLSIGKHIVEVTSQNKNIKLSKTKSSIKIKKAKAKIIAPKVVKRHSKLKVTVKNKASGKAISKTKFKVKISHGKTLNVKTNSKGIFKISAKNLTKNSYKCTIYLENKNYNIKNKFSFKVK